MSENDSTLLTATLEYHQRGFSLLPIKFRHDEDGNPIKKPRVKWRRFKEEPADRSLIEWWFRKFPEDIHGIATLGGGISGGIVCVDFDDAEVYKKWLFKNGELGATLPTALTISGGFHVMFRTAPEFFFFRKYAWGEYRGDNKHYWVLPPSKTPDGREYRWIHPPGETIPFVKDPYAAGFPLGEPSFSKIANDSYTSNSSIDLNTPPLTNPTLHIGGGHDTPTYYSSWIPTALPGRYGPFDHLIERNLPTGTRQRNGKLWEYVREVKTYGIQKKIRWDAGNMLLPLKHWWAQGEPFVRTKDFKVTLKDYLDHWAGYDPVKAVLTPPESLQGDLKGVCRWLADRHEDGVFFLRYEDAGKVLGKSKRAGVREIQKLIAEGFLVKVSTGSNLTYKANEYRITPLLSAIPSV